MRGKGKIDGLLIALLGITPAYAGKSDKKLKKCPNCEDHPRVCGEKSSAIGENYQLKGSPPRVRGKGFPYIHSDRPR